MENIWIVSCRCNKGGAIVSKLFPYGMQDFGVNANDPAGVLQYMAEKLVVRDVVQFKEQAYFFSEDARHAQQRCGGLWFTGKEYGVRDAQRAGEAGVEEGVVQRGAAKGDGAQA